MIEGKKNILEYYDTLTPTAEGEEYVYWIINSGHVKDGKPINSSSSEPGLTRTQARMQLEKQIALLHSGDYTLTCQANGAGKVKRGDKETKFRIPLNDASSYNVPQQAQIAGTHMVGYISKDEAEKLAEDRFEKQMLKYKAAEYEKRINDLEKENKEYEKESNGTFNKVLEMIAGIGQQFMAAKAQQPMPAIGTLHEQQTPTNDGGNDQQNMLAEVLQKTENIFKQEPVAYLHKLICFLEANPMYVGIIQNNVK
jgi:cell division protein FtsB